MLNFQFKRAMLFTALCSLLSIYYAHSQSANISGTLKKWHKITLTFTLPGANLSESSGTFRNNRMDVIFTRPDGTNIRVPGFYAAGGNAANVSGNGATNGTVYKAYLRADVTGSWSYRVLFYKGTNVALANVGNLPAPQYNITGDVGNISGTDKSAPDLRAKGRLQYQTTGTNNQRRYLKFAETGEYLLKIGPDSPENFLDYNDFDFAAPRNNCGLCTQHFFNPHSSDYNSGDPTWKGGKGKNIIGALNYLKQRQMNSISMSLFGGDDKNVFPWVNLNNRFVFDVSKLAQWEIVFDHAEKNGLLLHFKLAENENWDALNLDQIKVYYREMVARFGHHLALEWNISEEYRGSASSALPRIDWLAAIDPWKNHRVIHTYPGEHSKYQEWLNSSAKLTGASIQSSTRNNYNDAYDGSSGILTWINKSKDNGTPWVVVSDEQNPGSTGIFTSKNINTTSVVVEARTKILWKGLVAGAAGVMWYGGGEGDFKTENFNRFNTLFNWTKYAVIDFFKGNNLEYWKMANNDNLASGASNRCFAEVGRTYVIYLENGGSSNLNLNGQSGSFTVKWFDPRNGGALQNGNVTSISGGGNRSIGNPPNNASSDWVALVTVSGGNNVAVTGVTVSPATISLAAGQTRQLNASVSPTNATNKSVSWTSSNTNIATVNSSGVITAVRAGTATITCTTNNGNFTATSTVTVTTNTGCTTDYEEVNGMVIMEAEHLKVAGTNWKVQTNVAGFTGNAYINWTGADSFGNPGLGLITTTINIKTPGKYRFQWRSKVGQGTNSTEHNDSWLRFPDASAFYGEKNGNRVYPRGTGLTPNPNGSSKDGWFKVYLSSTTNWTWSSNTSDNDAHSIFVEFDSPGVYTMEISGRSKSHFIDRIALYRTGNGTNLSNPETPCSGGTPVTGISITPTSVSLEAGQTAQLNATISPSNATDQSVSWSSSNTTIATVNSNGLVTAINAGVASITCTSNDGNFTAISTITVSNSTVSRIAIPGRIEAEDFTNQSGVQNENTSDNGGGQNVGYINDGDFVEYAVDVASAGDYDLDFRVASATSGGTITISSNGNILGTVNVAGTGGWQTWTTLNTRVTLPAGDQTLRLDFSGTGNYLLNVNYIDASLVPEPVTTTLSPIHDAYLQGSKNFNNNILRVEAGNRVSYLMFDLSKINGTITDVKLKMTCSSDPGNGNLVVALGDQSNWIETNLSNANKPNATTTLGSLNTSYAIGTTYTWNLNASAINGGEIISFIVSQSGGNDAAFASSENTALTPQLEITYMPSGAPVAEANTPQQTQSFFRRSQLYPNPSVRGVVSLDLKGHGDQVKISVFNTFGKLVYEEISQGNQVKIKTQKFQKAGTYYVQLQSKLRTEMLRLSIY
ncbi:hypothetical protein BKI52_30675 [marine bacterium AO1-C]|nr:hypothetical protein BKI52_30675 [marine bacterium AO1-C]